ncbi:hypothetical protein QMY50_00625 [Escherichia coli]|nr:hypothetical protein QMY50_00625 [Escherichia coli]
MNIEKSRLISEAAPHLNASLGTINGNEFAAIVPVIPGHIGGKRKLTAVCSHQTRIGNLDAHLI